MATQFAFLHPEFPAVFDAARRAEGMANADPRAAGFYARRTLELLVTWAYEHDATLHMPYRDDLSALIHEASFRDLAGRAVFQKCRIIKDLGNLAVHGARELSKDDAASAVRELFHVCYWFARTYARGEQPDANLTFDPAQLPAPSGVPKQTVAKLQEMQDALAAEREKTFAALAEKAGVDEELKRLRLEVAAAKKANEEQPDTHNYNEAQTRDLKIDLYLREAGWPLDKPEDREFEVAGMPNEKGQGFVDYVLWGTDAKPLAIVEAKRTRRDARVGQHQAKLYADCLEAAYGQRPVIFYTNGYDHWIWNDSDSPPRSIQGFYTRAELELVIQRRTSRKPLVGMKIDGEIVERYYQTRAIRRVSEAFEKDRARQALLVMATGSGKTRTAIALVDVLMRANWAKRVLFLADRTALVKQAVNAFKRHLPDASPVNLVTEKGAEGRVFVSTYPTMLGLIDEGKGTKRSFGVGHFDLIIIDEAHRSIFMKYGAILEYFDCPIVGLTATPKEEIDRNTYELFNLENGVPTDAYTLEEAVNDGFLVPAKSVAVPLKLPAEGLTYDQLSEEDKERFELTDWKERADDVLEKGRVEAESVNKWFFNKNTVDKVLRHVMERGTKVEGGDLLGKTILFAKNHDHAMFIAERFNKHYPKYNGHFAQVIDFKTEYVQSRIDDFSDPKKLPQLAISVDMLDTGIDVPEVVNLVFFKQVRSKTKFWQMIGRGTRLCPGLFGPGQDKDSFTILDYCRNLEFFKVSPEGTEGASGLSLTARLFAMRLRLLSELSHRPGGLALVREIAQQREPETDEELFRAVVEILKSEVGAMNVDNFIVRAKRRIVEHYQAPEAWLELTPEKLAELEEQISGLPSEKPREAVESKQFDLLMLRLQLSLMKATPSFGKMRTQVQDIAAALEEASAIPMVKAQIGLIEDIQTDGWWQDVTLPMLEIVRLRLRSLVRLIEQRKGSPVIADFTDEMGEETEVSLPGFGSGISFERFREKARAFLRAHLDREAIQKLRMNEPLMATDLAELEAILRESGLADDATLKKASEHGLANFVRSLVGLDREAAKSALGGFVSEATLNADQIEFTNLIIDYLTEHGAMDPKILWESPFVDIDNRGPDGLFASDDIDRLIESLRKLQASTL